MYKIKLPGILIGLLFLSKPIIAQISGTVTIPGTYPTIAAAVSDINVQTIIGPLTVLITPGYIETAPAGGYTLTGTGTAANPIVFQKNGAGTNPLINAYTGGVGTPATAIQDGVFSFIGSDYITIDGIDIADPNTTNPSTMEYGYGFFKANATNGCQNNIIQNCVVTLRRINAATGSGPSVEGSKCIEFVNALIATHTTAVNITAAAGAHSNNKFYHNTLQNCNIGIALSGFASGSPFTLCDNNNDIGGNSILTGNTIINYGGGAITSPASAIYSLAQYNINVAYNTINNNNGAPGAANHTNTLRGIYLGPATSANAAVNNNTITVKGGGTSPTVAAVENAAGSTASSNTISITNNLITNCSFSTATSGQFYGILNYATAANVVINANDINGLVLNPAVTSGQTAFIYNSAVIGTALSITSNTIENANNISSSGNIYCMYNGTSTQNYTVQNNYVNNVSRSSGSNGAFYGFINGSTSAAGGTAVVSNNVFTNLSCGASSTFYGIYQWTSTSQVEIVSGNLFNNISLGLGSSYIIYHSSGNAGSAVSSNTISNILSQGSLIGIYHGNYSSVSLNINNNLIYALSNNSNGIAAMTQGGGTSTSIFKNKIYDITANGSGANAYGLTFNAGNNTYIYNNYIGDLKAPISSNPGTQDCIDGIEIQAGANFYISYNTIVLDAANGGSSFYTAALYTYTNSNITLRNNILINNSISNSGKAAAYRRNGNNLSPFNTNSNNNLLYAGGPGASYIYWDNTATPQLTLANYKTFVSPRDAAAVTENTQFLSMVGSSAGYLHIDPSVLTVAESGASNIAGITDDFDGDVRFGNPGYPGNGSAPDIGADEFDNVIPACNAVSSPTIGPLSQNKCYGQTASLTATGFTNGSGIVQQWQVSSSPGGPYTNISGANNPAAYTTPTLSTGTYYYVLHTTCTISSLSASSNESTVTVNAPPTISVSSGSVCAGQSFTMVPGGANTYTFSGGSAIVNPTTTTSYSVTGTSVAGCIGSNTAIATITVNALPVISVNSGSVCAGQSFTINPIGASTYTFSGGSAIVNPTITSSYSVSGTSTTGCTSSNTAVSNITVNALPGIIVNSGSICSGQSFTMVSGGANTYTFSGGSAIVNPTTTTSYSVTGTSTAGCISSNTAVSSVTVNAIPVVSINSGSICTGQSFTMIAGGANTYTFSGGSAIVNPTTTSSYSVTGTSAAGCVGSNTAIATITVNVLPVISVNSGSICSGKSFTMVPFGASTYTFSGGSAIVSPTVTSSYSVTGTSSLGCISSAPSTSTITVNATPTISATSGSVCSGNSFTIVPGGANSYTFSGGSAVVSPTTTTSYSVSGTSLAGCISTISVISTITFNALPIISVNNGSVCSGQSFTMVPSGASTYTFSGGSAIVSPTTISNYSVTGTSSLGCVSGSAAIANIVVNATPTISLSGGVICPGNTFTLNPVGAVNYTYSSGSQTVSPSVTTTYSVSGTSSVGCVSASPAVVTVTVSNTFTVTITGTNSICAGNTVSLTANGATSYSWSTGATSTTITLTPTATTTYSVIGTSGTCSNTAITSIIVNGLPTINVNSGTICNGQSFTMAPTGAVSYTISGGSAIVSPTATSAYSVAGSDANGCVSQTAISNITVNALPAISVSIINPTICAGQTTSLTASGANTYTWNTSTNSPQIIVSPVTTTIYTVNATGVNGCNSSSTGNITVNALPNLSITTSNSLICVGQTATLNVSGASTYTWNTSANGPQITVTPTLATTYTVSGTNNNSCVNTTTITQNVSVCTGLEKFTSINNEISIYPNPFTDKINIVSGGLHQTLEIFNSTGSLIYKTTIENMQTEIDLSNHANGIYFIRIGSTTKKIIKE